MFSFTQEWAAGSRKHQLSYSLPVQSMGDDDDGGSGFGNVAVNYRYQLIGSGKAKLAFSPRITVLFPTGSSRAGAVKGTIGLQGNLPLSIQPSRHFALHTNAGATVFPDARADDGARATIRSYNLGQSLVWFAAPRFNVLIESMWTGSESVVGPGRTENSDAVFVNPGVRWSYNLRGGLQIVPGVSFPIGVGPSRGDNSVLFYLSFEHPFRRVK